MPAKRKPIKWTEGEDGQMWGHTRQGTLFVVDYEDYLFLRPRAVTMNKQGWFYQKNPLHPKGAQIARSIINVPEGMEADHINGKPWDNRRVNLRICTRGDNCKNMSKQRRNTSGYKGVTYDKRRKKWQARAYVDGTYTSLGYFTGPLEAHKAYKEAAKKHYGEFARFD